MFTDLSLDKLNTAVVIISEKAQAVYLNQSAAQLFGVSLRHIQNDNFLDLIKADFNLSTLAKLSKQSHTGFIEDITLRTASGNINSNLMLSRLEENSQSFFLLEFQSNEYQTHIRKDMELLHQNKVSNDLIRNLAHEIKNPLGGVKGAAQLLERKLPPDVSKKYTQIIIQESNRLSKLVDRLLLPAEPEPKQMVNIHLLLERSLEVVSVQFPNSLKLIKDYDPSLPDLYVSPGQIQQALLNLIKNAAEAVQGVGVLNLKTRILLQHAIGKVQYRQVIRVDVIDNGPGIPDNLINDIFFPTISGKNSSGLGLSIAQSLVQRHGGIIEVESRPTNTCFSIYLPLEQAK